MILIVFHVTLWANTKAGKVSVLYSRLHIYVDLLRKCPYPAVPTAHTVIRIPGLCLGEPPWELTIFESCQVTPILNSTKSHSLMSTRDPSLVLLRWCVCREVEISFAIFEHPYVKGDTPPPPLPLIQQGRNLFRGCRVGTREKTRKWGAWLCRSLAAFFLARSACHWK